MRKEFNSHTIGLGQQHGRRFIVLGHQYGRRDVMWKHFKKNVQRKEFSRPFISFKISRYSNEAKCKTFLGKWVIYLQGIKKFIFTSMASHLASL